ncbi:MAG: hypothetical protein V1827_05505 [Candidatus Micrarchaeota archaeon]
MFSPRYLIAPKALNQLAEERAVIGIVYPDIYEVAQPAFGALEDDLMIVDSPSFEILSLFGDLDAEGASDVALA